MQTYSYSVQVVIYMGLTCMHTYIHTYILACMHTYIHTYIAACKRHKKHGLMRSSIPLSFFDFRHTNEQRTLFWKTDTFDKKQIIMLSENTLTKVHTAHMCIGQEPHACYGGMVFENEIVEIGCAKIFTKSAKAQTFMHQQ